MISFFICLLLLIGGYFVYGKVVENTFAPDDRETPAVKINDGVDYVVMPQWKLFLVQLLNIAGLGPIFGAMQGALWGPVVFLWITFGTIFAGGVHDYFSGMLSERNEGASISEVCGIYLGGFMKNVMRIFSVVLLVMVGTVFAVGPAGLIVTLFKNGNVSGIVAGIISMNVYHMTDPDRMHFSIGASGAVFGIICAAVFLTFMGNRKASRKDMMVSIVVVVIYALYTNEKNIDIYAHVGGAIVGGILAFALNIKRWEKFRENKFCKLLAVILTLSMCVTGIGEAGIGKDAADLPDKRIDYIKEQKIFPDGDTTYGDGLDAYCSDEHWQAFVATDGSQIVQFEGNATYKGQQVTVTVQFQIEGDCEGYQPGYVGLNDVGQNSESATEFMLTVCGRSINELKYGR